MESNNINTAPLSTGEIPTQVQFSAKAALRTAIQTAVPTLLTVAAVLMIAAEQFKGGLPPEITATIIAVGGFIVTAATFLTLVMGLPQVNLLLTKFGLGAVPKHSQETLEAYLEKFPVSEAQKIPGQSIETVKSELKSFEEGVG